MLRRDVLDLVVFEGLAAQDFITDVRVEALDHVNQFQRCIRCQSIELSCQCYVLMHNALEIETRAHDFVASASSGIISAMG